MKQEKKPVDEGVGISVDLLSAALVVLCQQLLLCFVLYVPFITREVLIFVSFPAPVLLLATGQFIYETKAERRSSHHFIISFTGNLQHMNPSFEHTRIRHSNPDFAIVSALGGLDFLSTVQYGTSL